MKNKIIIISVIALLLSGYIVKRCFMKTGAPQSEPVLVQASTVKEVMLPQEAHAIGTLTARSVEITPEIAGHVQAILFKDGAFVKTGTSLIQLDSAVYKAKYASARAKLTYSDNNYKNGIVRKARCYCKTSDRSG